MTYAAGSLAWMAPEVFKGDTYSEKADVWSFGMVLWEMCTGEYPYQESPPANFAAQVAYKGFRPMIPQSCGPLWANLILSCWREAPDRPSFVDILRRLEEIRVYMINEVLDTGGLLLNQPNPAQEGGTRGEMNDNGYFVLNHAGILEPTADGLQDHRYSSGEGAEQDTDEDY